MCILLFYILLFLNKPRETDGTRDLFPHSLMTDVLQDVTASQCLIVGPLKKKINSTGSSDFVKPRLYVVNNQLELGSCILHSSRR